MIKVIFDTNFLIYAVDFKGDIFQVMEDAVGQHIEKILLSPILEEVRHLAVCGPNKIQHRAQKVLELIQDKQLKEKSS